MNLFFFRHNTFVPVAALDAAHVNFNELTLLLNGNATYYVNGKTVPLKKGDAVFLKNGSLRARDDINADYVSFNFDTADDENIDLPAHIRDGVTTEIKLLLSACDEIRKKNIRTNELGSLNIILGCIINQLSANLKMQSFSPLTLTIKDYIQNNLDKRITLESIGKATNFSPVYCSEIFKKETGESIISYAINEKIQEAKRLLFEDVPLNEIAENLGFENYNYFSRIFKKRVCYSPLQYKTTFFK